MSLVSIKEAAEANIKKLPSNLDAEQYVLGCLLNDNENINKIGDFLREDHFFEPIHGKIFRSIINLYDKGIQANPVTLQNHFQQDEAFSTIGGSSYLINLCSISSGILNIKDYALIIYNMATSRSLINICNETLEECYNSTGETTTSEQIEIPEGKLFSLASTGYSEKGFNPLKHSLAEVLKSAELAAKNKGGLSGVPSKFTDIDNLLGGFNKSDLVIIAARPSMGKTALALNFAVNTADSLNQKYQDEIKAYQQDKSKFIEEPKKGSVGFFSLEMSSEQLATRMIAMKSGLNAFSIRQGRLNKSPNNDEYEKLINAYKEMEDTPIFIDDTPALSVSAIRTRARRLKRKHNLQVLFVDYLQLLRGVNKKSQESRVQEISEISMGLKAIAKELDIPVIALSQLSRQVEQRADKKPQLSDLRESGSIEQDSDIVMFIYREAYYKEREKPSEENQEQMLKWQEEMERIDNISEIIVAKNRNGPINSVRIYFDKNTTKFNNLDGHLD